ncbi:BMP family ABC transporter substrate-binding protein [candidate division KSB3 bacterium]|uniref:BMP family ABC transporter substrate-binding protein n=1 Tax=candidate division KSB3 bacterium TaxID=2044937 RepID=A0A2G6KDP6_9BACT|nr:MAG: BMP family ABC transporter substrate-binding protein [candidate division KSB3 bacterium]
MKKRVLVLIVFGLMMGCLTSVAQADAPKVAMVIAGTLGDRSFYDSGNEGLMRAASEFEIETKTFECRNVPSAYSEQIIAAAQSYNVVFTVGWELVDPLLEVAPEFPDVKFIHIDAAIEGVDNVSSIDYLENEGSFVAGAMAAMMTSKTADSKINEQKIIGAVGGMDIPVIRNFVSGYEAGAKYIDPDVKVEVGFVGSFEDPAKGKEMGLTIAHKGADIVFQIAGNTGNGVIEAAKEAGFYAIGVDSDQGYIAPGFIMGSMMKRVGLSIFETIQKILDGTYEDGSVMTYGIAQNGVGMSKDADMAKIVGDEVMQKLEEIEKGIVDGSIPVPERN